MVASTRLVESGALNGVAGERVGVIEADLGVTTGGSVVVAGGAGQVDGADLIEVHRDAVAGWVSGVGVQGGHGAERAVADVGRWLSRDVKEPVGSPRGDAISHGKLPVSGGGDLLCP